MKDVNKTRGVIAFAEPPSHRLELFEVVFCLINYLARSRCAIILVLSLPIGGS